MTHYSRLLLLLLLCAACSRPQTSDMTPEEFVSGLPQVEPVELLRLQSADSAYFSFIGIETISLEDGSFLLYDRSNNPFLLQIARDGEPIRYVARDGRGPGEVIDINAMTQTYDGGVLVYDPSNSKLIRYNNELEYMTEIVVQASAEQALPDRFFATETIDRYTTVLHSHAHLFDVSRDPGIYVAGYDGEAGLDDELLTLPARRYARHIENGQVFGGMQVRYTPNQLIEQAPEKGHLYLYWTASDIIAEVNANMDTVRTISVDLPGESLNASDRDSLRENTRSVMWETVEDLLPEVKTPVEAMKVGPEGEIWLQLNYRGETQKWLVLDREGNPQTIVHLPKGGMLTHVSDHHLGVRLDDATFALYEPL